jgi:hypothetical protein
MSRYAERHGLSERRQCPSILPARLFEFHQPHEKAGAQVVAADTSGVLVATGDLAFDVSTEAVVEMNDAPTSPPTAATTLLRFWQSNLAASASSRWRRGRSSRAPCRR